MSRPPEWPTASCPNGHDAYGYDPDLGTPRCQECDAEERDKVTPEDATPEVLEAWIADHGQPDCRHCGTGEQVVWVPVRDRPEPGARWRCASCRCYLDANGQEIRRELQAAQAAEKRADLSAAREADDNADSLQPTVDRLAADKGKLLDRIAGLEAQVQRVRETLESFEYDEPIGADIYRARNARELANAIHAALDGEAPEDEIALLKAALCIGAESLSHMSDCLPLRRVERWIAEARAALDGGEAR